MNLRLQLALVFVLLTAFGLRVHGLDAESLWADEGYSISLARHDLGEIVRGTAADQHPPLYYLLLHAWITAGESVFQVRYLSVLFGLLAVSLMGWIGRLVGEDRLAFIAAGLMAVSPMHVWYSQEARMYILLCTLGIISGGLCWKLARGEGKPRHWLGFLISSSLAIYTHYFAFFLLCFENLAVALWISRTRQVRNWYRWLAGQVILVLAFAPWIPTALYQARFHRMTWMPVPNWPALRETLILMSTGLTGRTDALYYLAMGWTVCAMLAGARAIWKERSRTQRAALFAFLWWAVPIFLILAISQRYPIFQQKQVLIFLPGLLLYAACALCSLPRWAAASLLTGALLLAGFSLSTLYGDPQKQGWREAARYISLNQLPGDGIYLNPAAADPTLTYYLTEPMPIRGYPPGYDIVRGGWRGELLTPKIAAAELAPLADEHPRIWLVQFSAGFWDPGNALPTWLSEHGRLLAEQSFRGVDVRIYETRASNE